MSQLAVNNSQTVEIPEKIGKYDIINLIGQGSTGNVYLSHDPYYGRDVAIKVYNIEADDDPRAARIARKMFFNEAQIVGMLQHPNILPIYDAGEEDGRYYVVMEHIQGARTLASYCRPDNLLPVDDVVKLIYKCAKALNYAHGRGLIHRDIKPSNVMLTLDNDVRIIDFGISILKDADTSRIEGIAGSPSYMSPEQIQSIDLTPTSDIYSLAAVMYEMLTGFRPFRASNLSKLLHQVVYATAAPIHTLRQNIPEELEDVVAKAMLKDPAARHTSGNELAGDLTRVYHALTEQYKTIDNQEHFDLLRRLSFFHEFSHGEIRELLRASEWRSYEAGDDVVREGEMDDRFYVVVEGQVEVRSQRRLVGTLNSGDCFGETSYVEGIKRTATIHADQPVTILSVSATLLEQVSTECQLRFNKVFLRSLIQRLQGSGAAART